MKCLVLYKDRLDALPPLMNSSLLLAQMGASVHVLCGGISGAARSGLEELGIVIRVTAPQDSSRTPVTRVRRWAEFHRQAMPAIQVSGPDALLWVGSGDTALALGPGLWRHRYVLQLHELYDTHPHYRLMLSRFIAKAACVVVPEAGRAGILRMWYRLRETPVVLPNKFVCHPRSRRLDLSGVTGAAQVDNGRKLVLYQGHVGRDRDLLPVARAAADLGPAWRFAVMGTDWGGAAVLRSACPDLLVIPHTPAPGHLRVTSHARIGVVSYAHTSLNNLFCAPNKVWEYAGFGIPMVCNDVPGLAPVSGNGAGICADFSNTRSIAAAILELDRDYAAYSANARRLFDSVDMPAIMRAIVERATNAAPVPNQRAGAFFES